MTKQTAGEMEASINTRPDHFRATVDTAVYCITTGSFGKRDRFAKTYLTRKGREIFDDARAAWDEGHCHPKALRAQCVRAVRAEGTGHDHQ